MSKPVFSKKSPQKGLQKLKMIYKNLKNDSFGIAKTYAKVPKKAFSDILTHI
jgi:hypothetical protein